MPLPMGFPKPVSGQNREDVEKAQSTVRNGSGKVTVTDNGSVTSSLQRLSPTSSASASTLPTFWSYTASNENSTSSAVNG